MTNEDKILYENYSHWVYDAGSRGFEVYKKTSTHSVRVACIGRSLGLEKAIEEANKRHARTYHA